MTGDGNKRSGKSTSETFLNVIPIWTALCEEEKLPRERTNWIVAICNSPPQVFTMTSDARIANGRDVNVERTIQLTFPLAAIIFLFYKLLNKINRQNTL